MAYVVPRALVGCVALCHVCDRRMWSSDMSVYERDAFLESLLVDGVVHMVHVRAHRG
jgi:hypothetical protein